jgi:three-Cys-motif partner protein
LSDSDLYAGREQTRVKHFILQEYLQRFAIIVGHHRGVITYVDCFSGPWNVRSDDLSDSSFSIALQQLRKAREALKTSNKNLKIRCLFLENDPNAFVKLRQFTDSVKDAEVHSLQKELEDAIPDILDFVRQGGPQAFPFLFIDPTGWTGIALETIAPLLRITPGEVLINFMTGHISRFLESPQAETQESFRRLFFSSEFQSRLQGFARRDREDAAVAFYCEQVKQIGSYQYVCPSIVLHPEKDRTHFHLIYATRNLKGVEVFKATEKRSVPVMEEARGEARKRKREKRTGQRELYAGKETHDPSYVNGLRQRYNDQAKKCVLDILKEQASVPYDDLWSASMAFPLTWETDLKAWLNKWKKEGTLAFHKMKANQRVPRLGAGNIVELKEPRA